MNTKILAVAGGFYFFGTEVQAPDGYVALVDAAMFGEFSGGKGIPGVSRGDAAAKVTLDRYEAGKEVYYPISAVYAIMPSVDLYKFKGTTLR